VSGMDFNDAQPRDFDVIPDGTVVVLHGEIRPGGAGDGGWLKASKDGQSEGLDWEFTIPEGLHKGRKLFERHLISGTTAGHQTAAEITRGKIRQMLESARGIRPDDQSEAAKQARRINSYADLDGIRFMARLGVEPAKNGFKAKSVIEAIITPDEQEWRKIDQVVATVKPGSNVQAQSSMPVTTAKPDWAK
jgi:hypothetical protein